MKYRKFLIFSIAAIMVLGIFSFAEAGIDAGQAGMKEAAKSAGYGSEKPNLLGTIGQIISTVIGILGVVLFLIILYGGYLYMTGGDDQNKLKEAKGWITNGIIGVIIILLSYAIAKFVIEQLNTAFGG